MKILFIGDIFANPGLKITKQFLNEYRHDYDFVIANGENVAGGKGITRKHFKELKNMGIDVITLGNHVWDNREALEIVEESPTLIRPYNLPPSAPGFGYYVFTTKSGEKMAVCNLLGRVYMDSNDCPFRSMDAILEEHPADIPILVDFHAEATSEKKVLAYYLRGHVSALVGTHTHIPTADARIDGGTAYITDVGMTGVSDSAIGMDYEAVLERFIIKQPRRFKPADGDANVNAVAITLDGPVATDIEQIQWYG